MRELNLIFSVQERLYQLNFHKNDIERGIETVTSDLIVELSFCH